MPSALVMTKASRSLSVHSNLRLHDPCSSRSAAVVDCGMFRASQLYKPI